MSAVRVAILAWFGLFLLHVVWHGWLAPPENGQILLLNGAFICMSRRRR